MMDAHLKNVEKSSFGGKFDPYAGLTTSGIAGTGPDKDKEDEDNKVPGAAGSASTGAPSTPGSTDIEMKDASKKDDGMLGPMLQYILLFQPSICRLISLSFFKGLISILYLFSLLVSLVWLRLCALLISFLFAWGFVILLLFDCLPKTKITNLIKQRIRLKKMILKLLILMLR